MEEPFDPRDMSWTRVSNRLATLRRAELVVVVVLVSGAAVAAAATSAQGLVAAGIVLLGVVVVGVGWRLIGRSQRAWGYTEREDDLLVRRGVAFRQLTVVPYGRMQFVDVTAGPLQRRFGLSTVQLHTAAAKSDARIPGLVPAEAARLRDRLAARGESRAAGL